MIDLEETKDELIVRAELPGMKKEEIKVSTIGNSLTLRGERKQKREKKANTYHRIEQRYGHFERVIPLPFEVKTEKVKASYRDGILQITFPKLDKVKLKEISTTP